MDAEAFVACFWEVSQKASPASRAGRYCSFADRRKDESPTALTMAAVIMRAHHRQRSPNSAAPTVVLVDQSMLTGEAMPVEAAAGKNAYAGALVTRGEATGKVIATGIRTYYGRTAEVVSVAYVESAEQKAVFGVVRI